MEDASLLMAFFPPCRVIDNDKKIGDKPEDFKQAHVASIQQTLNNK